MATKHVIHRLPGIVLDQKLSGFSNSRDTEVWAKTDQVACGDGHDTDPGAGPSRGPED